MRGIGGTRSASDAASRNDRQGIDAVRAAQRFVRHRGASATEVRVDVRRVRRNLRLLTVFQRPLLLGSINDAEVVDAGVGLRGLTSSHEVGNRDSRQQADNGDDDHDFNQRKAGFTDVFDCFHFLTFWSVWRWNRTAGGLYMITYLFT